MITRSAGGKPDRLKKKHLQLLSLVLDLRLREEPGAALDLQSKGPEGELDAVKQHNTQTKRTKSVGMNRGELEKVCLGNEIVKEVIRANVC